MYTHLTLVIGAPHGQPPSCLLVKYLTDSATKAVELGLIHTVQVNVPRRRKLLQDTVRVLCPQLHVDECRDHRTARYR